MNVKRSNLNGITEKGKKCNKSLRRTSGKGEMRIKRSSFRRNTRKGKMCIKRLRFRRITRTRKIHVKRLLMHLYYINIHL